MTSFIHSRVDLTAYNSFAVPATAAWFADITSREQAVAALDFARQQDLPLLILGDGSNCLFLKDFPGLVLHLANTGIDWLDRPGQVRAAAGENWHQFVIHCMNNSLHGIENLALIPGTVGAAPIQNIGAYGVELEQFFVSLEAIELSTGESMTLEHEACEFAYRDSVFKRASEPQWLIWSVTLQLARDWQPVTSYGALRDRLTSDSPSHQQVFDTVCKIRQSKLPDPARIGNAGSFFKNPLVSAEKLTRLRQEFDDLPAYATGDADLVKIPAAWLLEQAGWKGCRRGPAGVHDKHALVLVNHGGASGEDIYLLAQEMSASVLSRFGIALQPEVRII